MRPLAVSLIILYFPLAAFGAEKADVLFFAPFENSTDARIAEAGGQTNARVSPRFAPGVRGRAVVLGADDELSYPFRGNCLTDEGTVMMWVKPEWRSDDDRFHYLFRANTGHFGGKGLNAVMLYKYRSLDKLLFYTSQPYGVPTFLLPTLTKFQPESKEKMPGMEFLAFPLLHDVICVRSYLSRETRGQLLAIQQAMRDFGVADGVFVPYWDNAAELAVSPPGTKVSAYLRHDGTAAMLIAQGPGDPATVALTFKGRLAPLRGAALRGVLESGEPEWRDGRLIWSLPDRDVRLAVVEAKGT